jgi:hypothetical protein
LEEAIMVLFSEYDYDVYDATVDRWQQARAARAESRRSQGAS